MIGDATIDRGKIKWNSPSKLPAGEGSIQTISIDLIQPCGIKSRNDNARDMCAYVDSFLVHACKLTSTQGYYFFFYNDPRILLRSREEMDGWKPSYVCNEYEILSSKKMNTRYF
jgi:hypothetical protein